MDSDNVTAEHQSNKPDVMPEENSKSILEAILFAASEPISVKQFQHAIPGISVREIRRVLSELRDDYQEMNRSFCLIEIANGISDMHPSRIFGMDTEVLYSAGACNLVTISIRNACNCSIQTTCHPC